MASGTKTLAFAACSLCSCFLAAPEAAGGTGLSPLKPPAQAAPASAAVRAAAATRSEQRQRAAAGQKGSEAASAASCKVQKPRNHTNEHISKSWDCITSAGAPRGVSASLPEREQRLVLLRPGPFPHAGRWESLATRRSYRGDPRTACAPASLEIVTVTCRVRNNRIICQSSDPLEGMAITLNQWILLTARAIQSDAVAPNACRGTRLPSPQVPDVAR